MLRGLAVLVALALTGMTSPVLAHPVSNSLSMDMWVQTPASFVCSALNITPAEVDPGEEFCVGLWIENVGEAAGVYSVNLSVNGAVVQTRGGFLFGGGAERLEFLLSLDKAGTYNIEVGGLTGLLLVRAPALPVSVGVNWPLLTGILVAAAAVAWLFMRSTGLEVEVTEGRLARFKRGWRGFASGFKKKAPEKPTESKSQDIYQQFIDHQTKERKWFDENWRKLL